MLHSSIAHIINVHGCFAGKMHSDWFNKIEILQGRWQHGEKVGYCYPSRLEKTLCKWDTYVRIITNGLTHDLIVLHQGMLLFVVCRTACEETSQTPFCMSGTWGTLPV